MRVLWILVLCLAAVQPAAAQSVKAGIDAWQRGEYARAIGIWRPLAQAGDADAAFNLGQAFRLGRGVAIDLAVAQRWLRQAAAKGHVDAQATLGLLLFQNGDRTEGLTFLAKAADRGEPRALLIYGTALFNGDGVRRDPVRGYAYVSRAAAQGLAPAKETLAEMDQALPVEQRQKGVAMALDQADRKAAASTARSDAKASPVALGKWRIQLGAFANRASADALFKRVSGLPAISGRQLFLVPAGAVTRLQVGPFADRAAAAAACKALAARGQACFPVGP